jgi:uncharacterized membrane protein
VQWPLGLVVAAFQGAGAWLAVHATLRRGAGFVRIAMIAIVAASAAALFAGLRV